MKQVTDYTVHKEPAILKMVLRDSVTIHIPIDWQARYPRWSSVFLQYGIGWSAKASLSARPDALGAWV